MKNARFVGANKIREKYNVSTATLQSWDKRGLVPTIRTVGGKRLYDFTKIEELFQSKTSTPSDGRQSFIYARVSSAPQSNDLQRQKEELQQAYPTHTLIEDIGSGLNWKRPGFTRILDALLDGDVQELVVTHRDRLCRYGGELLDHIMDKAKCRFVVLSKTMEEHDPSAELAEDLLSVVTVFVARNNGLRAGQNRRRRKQEEELRELEASTQEAQEGASSAHEED